MGDWRLRLSDHRLVDVVHLGLSVTVVGAEYWLGE